MAHRAAATLARRRRSPDRGRRLRQHAGTPITRIACHAALAREAGVVLTTGQREMTAPGSGAQLGDGGSSFRRILVPVRSPDESCPALAVAARICGMTGGVLRLVHVRTCDPPLPISGRFYLETPGEAAAVPQEALLMAWACGGPRATTAVVEARRPDVAGYKLPARCHDRSGPRH